MTTAKKTKATNAGHARLLELSALWKKGEVEGMAAYEELCRVLDGGEAELEAICQGDEPDFEDVLLMHVRAAGVDSNGPPTPEQVDALDQVQDFLEEMESWIKATAQAQNSGGR